jgi:hypothetical protein
MRREERRGREKDSAAEADGEDSSIAQDHAKPGTFLPCLWISGRMKDTDDQDLVRIPAVVRLIVRSATSRRF